VIEVDDYESLLAAWPYYRVAVKDRLIARFVVKKPLTEAQFHRLPVDLRELVETDDAVSWLEWLHSLEDPR